MGLMGMVYLLDFYRVGGDLYEWFGWFTAGS